jgi:hypothetical protein
MVLHIIHFPASEHSLSFLVITEIWTSTVEINDESRGRPFQKAKVNKIKSLFSAGVKHSLSIWLYASVISSIFLLAVEPTSTFVSPD